MVRFTSIVCSSLWLTGAVQAFTIPHARAPRSTSLTRTHLAEKNSQDGVFISSVRKEIGYDEKTGRFYETNIDRENCVPDEEFCVVDDQTGQLIRLTVEEKERIFMDALQAYYSSGRKTLTDEDFDLLKEDLQWSGSSVVVMNRKEAQYLQAVQNYLKGTPTMSNTEFDQLKKDLQEEGSKFAVQTEPKCFIDTGICKFTLQEDKFRSNLLYLPGVAVFSLIWLGLGFELIEPIIRLNPVLLTLLGTPFIYNLSKWFTEEVVFPNKLIAYGPCPSCQAENRVYFGDILGVQGFDKDAKVKCPNCKVEFTVLRSTLRASTLPKTG